ncbi:MAG: alkaline phosphatase D family protein [Crocinitomicaceae bacterium]|nr:alkaline phosphatase D family protein [Crocinitomicaceae bacterium]
MQDELLVSTAQWKILVQQVMVAPLEVAGFGVNGDQWDGYPAERDRLYDFITTNDMKILLLLQVIFTVPGQMIYQEVRTILLLALALLVLSL